MIPCVCGKKIIASQMFQCYFRINKGHDHILLVDDKKVTEAVEHCGSLLGQILTSFHLD